VLDALLALRGGERDAREGGRESARRAAALAARADAADAEASELRALLAAAAGAASAPAARDVAKLLLDPAAARELSRLTTALDAARESLKQKDEEIAALGFSKDSKSGRMLMARVRMLIKENDDFGAQVSEGRLHTLETEIVLLREQVSALKRAYSELEDSARALNAENEELQLRAFGLPEAAAAAEVAGGGGGVTAGAAAEAEAGAGEAEPEAAAAVAAGGRGAKRPRRGGKAADEGA
jgi:chromosome segregation ATPase